MIIVITALIIIACVAVGFFVLVQNPKGGGLSGSFGSIGNQVMGVKQSSDVMEKGTWIAIGVVAALCILSVTFYEKPSRQVLPIPSTQNSAPAAPAPAAPAQGGATE